MPDDINNNQPPKLVRRREHKKSTMRLGRTIGETREKLETSNERALARKKDKQKKALRILISSTIFLVMIIAAIVLLVIFISSSKEPSIEEPTSTITDYTPTIEIIDEGTSSANSITNRMKEYIGQLEYDLKELGLNPVRAIIRPQAIREVDIFLKDHNGYLKTIIDRGAGVTAEDALRMLKYLEEQGITDFEYIDLRVDNKAYWR